MTNLTTCVNRKMRIVSGGLLLALALVGSSIDCDIHGTFPLAQAQETLPTVADPISTRPLPKAVLETPDPVVEAGEAMFFDASGSVVSREAVIEWTWPDKSFRVIDKNDLSAMAKAPKEPGLFTVMFTIHDTVQERDQSGVLSVRPVGSSAFKTVLVTGPQPNPAPTPVDPSQPSVPTPTTPSTSPIKTPGFRAVFVYKASEGIPAVLSTPEFMSYMNQKTAKGLDGKTPEWRRYADTLTADAIRDYPTMEEYLKQVPQGSASYMVMGNGTTYYAGPIPTSGAELMAEVKKHGG